MKASEARVLTESSTNNLLKIELDKIYTKIRQWANSGLYTLNWETDNQNLAKRLEKSLLNNGYQVARTMGVDNISTILKIKW